MIPRLTKEQAAIIGAYTLVAAGPFGDIHRYVEQKLGHGVMSHEFADNQFVDSLRAVVREDFLALCYEEPSA